MQWLTVHWVKTNSDLLDGRQQWFQHRVLLGGVVLEFCVHKLSAEVEFIYMEGFREQQKIQTSSL